jgi:hypothetical protein
MLKKALLIVIAAAFMCVPALAGERPEFDCVGDDSANYFNDFIKEMVVMANPWNLDSDFTGLPVNAPDCDNFQTPPCLPPYELFDGPFNESDDICFPNYRSHLTPAGVIPAVYVWKIVLQMTPDTDLNINIIDCITKRNSQTAFGDDPDEGAHQTGRYFEFGFLPMFDPARNPRMSAVAIPGPNAVFGFNTPFVLTNRMMLTLNLIPFWQQLYTSKAIWDEGLIVKLPKVPDTAFVPPMPWPPPFDVTGFDGFEHPLVAGDIIYVIVNTPAQNPVDIRYGKDNVCIKYVGISGTELRASDL